MPYPRYVSLVETREKGGSNSSKDRMLASSSSYAQKEEMVGLFHNDCLCSTKEYKFVVDVLKCVCVK